MKRRIEFRVAPGGIEELRFNGLELRDRNTGDPLAECSAEEAAEPGMVLFGMRAGDPGRQVPGTRDGYQCARCGEGMRLAPSGQRLAASGAVTWCVECIPFFGGPEA